VVEASGKTHHSSINDPRYGTPASPASPGHQVTINHYHVSPSHHPGPPPSMPGRDHPQPPTTQVHRRPSPKPPPMGHSGYNSSDEFDRIDSNGDGVLDREEYNRAYFSVENKAATSHSRSRGNDHNHSPRENEPLENLSSRQMNPSPPRSHPRKQLSPRSDAEVEAVVRARGEAEVRRWSVRLSFLDPRSRSKPLKKNKKRSQPLKSYSHNL